MESHLDFGSDSWVFIPCDRASYCAQNEDSNKQRNDHQRSSFDIPWCNILLSITGRACRLPEGLPWTMASSDRIFLALHLAVS